MNISSALVDQQRWNRYAYANNDPLRFFDPDGRETKLLVGKHTESNPAGHMAIAINNVVFSFGTDWTRGQQRDWGVNLEAYLSAQAELRQTKILTLNVSPQREALLLAELQRRNPNAPGAAPYHMLFNSCVTVCETPLRNVGVLPGAGAVKIDRAGNLVQAGAPSSILPYGSNKRLCAPAS